MRCRILGAAPLVIGAMIYAKILTVKGDKFVAAIVSPMSKLGGAVGLKVTTLGDPNCELPVDIDQVELPSELLDALLAMTAWSAAGHIDTALTVVSEKSLHCLRRQLKEVAQDVDYF